MRLMGAAVIPTPQGSAFRQSEDAEATETPTSPYQASDLVFCQQLTGFWSLSPIEFQCGIMVKVGQASVRRC